MLEKDEFDWFTGPRRETDLRYKFDFNVILKNLGVQIEIISYIFDWISK